jgi:hypothetical protein
MSKRKKTVAKDVVEVLNCNDEEIEENGFMEGEIDFSKYSSVASFSFASNNTELNASEVQAQDSESLPKAQAETKEAEPHELVDNRKLQTQPNGITPPVDGEYFEVSRTFKFRRSTVKILNRLKAEHEDENVYLSSIVDEAIRYYYGGVFNRKAGAESTT